MVRVEKLYTHELGLEGVLGRLRRPYSLDQYVEKVRPIVEAVAREGYPAVRRFSEEFDGRGFDDPRVGVGEVERAVREVDERVLWALETAARSVRAYHEAIMPRPVRAGAAALRWVPVERVAVYAPGGAKPYPSTVLMAAIPARVAGSRLVVTVSPPCRVEGFKVHPLILAAAKVAGVDAVYAVGGAQAIAGLAFGAHPLPRVDLVAGPGSPYVEAAKLLVSGRVGVDMVAGPSEVAIVADGSADPLLASYDLLAQAEHGPLSTALLATPSEELASQVSRTVAAVEGEHLGRVVIVVTRSLEEAARLVDLYAPEHLEILAEEPLRILGLVGNAGAVSLGEPVALLDYAAGPSHVLPTGGSARWRGGLSVYDFLKPVAVASGIATGKLLEAAMVLARAEGFEFHARSLEVRMG